MKAYLKDLLRRVWTIPNMIYWVVSLFVFIWLARKFGYAFRPKLVVFVFLFAVIDKFLWIAKDIIVELIRFQKSGLQEEIRERSLAALGWYRPDYPFMLEEDRDNAWRL